MNASDQMRMDQIGQEGRIGQGMDIINAIFNGGTYGTGRVNTTRPGQTYYSSSGVAFPALPSSAFFSSPAYQGVAKFMPNAIAANPKLGWNSFLNEYAKNFGLYTGKTSSTGFDDAFYNKAKQGYEDFALPQLASQFNNTNNQLQGRLANQGLLGGSAATKMNSALNRETGLQKLNIVNTGIGIENDLRTKVGNEKNNLVNQLITSGNPGLAQQGALQSAASVSAPSALPAVGNLFSNFITQYLMSQQNGSGGGSQSSLLRLGNPGSQTNVYGIGR